MEFKRTLKCKKTYSYKWQRDKRRMKKKERNVEINSVRMTLNKSYNILQNPSRFTKTFKRNGILESKMGKWKKSGMENRIDEKSSVLTIEDYGSTDDFGKGNFFILFAQCSPVHKIKVLWKGKIENWKKINHNRNKIRSMKMKESINHGDRSVQRGCRHTNFLYERERSVIRSVELEISESSLQSPDQKKYGKNAKLRKQRKTLILERPAATASSTM